MSPNHRYFYASKAPFFRFVYQHIYKNWTAEKQKSEIRFLPGPDVGVLFEYPPSIAVIDWGRIKEGDLTFLDDGKSSNGRLVFLKGWERKGLLFEKGDQKVVIGLHDDHPEYGLSVAETRPLIETNFAFIDPEQLSKMELIQIVNDRLPEEMSGLQRKSRSTIHWQVESLVDKYLLSAVNMPDGPKFEVLKKDLSCRKL